MEDIAVQLADALRERLAIVADEPSRLDPASHIERLKKISERIDNLRQRLPQPLHPQLAHFLDRSSYNKALEFLENSSPSL